MPSTREVIAAAQARLARAGVPSPRADAELLVAHVTGRPRGSLVVAGEIGAEEVAQLATLVDRRATRVPLQHLIGRAPFRHLEVLVGPGVFVPRPETELLVDAALAHLRSHRSRSGARVAVDLCTGSAAIALALATEQPGLHVHAVELDPQAEGWARRNIDEHVAQLERVGSEVRLWVADATQVAEPGGALHDLRGGVDVVVSNPPYVPDDAVPKDPEVRDHDPALALFGGPDGLDVIRSLVGQAARLLRPEGLLVLEHADVQGEEPLHLGVPALLRALPEWTDVADHRDLAGLPRFTTALRGRRAVLPE